MKKKSVNLITAVGVLVVLSGAYVGVKTYVAKQDAEEAEADEEESQEIISIASDDVKSVKFVMDKKEVTFEKDGDSWVKSDETAFPVDQDKMDTLISSLSSVKAERTLEDVEDASEYELDQPENTITVTMEDGSETVIRVGMENDSTSQEYIALDKDSSTVYVVSNSTFQSFEGTLYDFAESGTFPTVDSSTISKVSVDEKDSSYSIEKDENNFWNITENGNTEKADSAKATSLTSAVSGMAYASFVNYDCSDEELSQYGLDKPYAEITVDYREEIEKDSADEKNEAKNGSEDATEAPENANQDEKKAADSEESTADDTAENDDAESANDTDTDEATADSEEDAEEAVDEADTDSEEEVETEVVDRELVIQVGDESSDGGRYVRVNDSNEIYTISEDTLDTFLGKTAADFWDLTVSYLSVNNLETLDINYKGDEYTVNVSRETSSEEEESCDETDVDNSTDDSAEDASSSATVTLSYKLNGAELDSATFTTFYNKLINLAAQKRLTDKFESNADPEMTVDFTDVDGNKTTVEYYSYDTNYYAAVTDGKTYLINKMTAKELFQAFETVAGIEENSTSDTDDNAEEEGTAASNSLAEDETDAAE